MTLAALIALAACGDNLPAPRLAPARYVYDDGTEQVDRNQLYDRTLGTLCTPTLFSDGATYCKPPTDYAFYTDSNCTHAISRVNTGETPRAFTATTFELGSPQDAFPVELPSHVFRTGNPVATPTQQWRRVDNFCFSYPFENGYDYYDTAVVDLARVRMRSVEMVDAWQVDHIEADGLSLPWRARDPAYGPCEIVDRSDQSTTWCSPTAAELVSWFADASCTMPMIASSAPPPLAFLDEYDSNVFYKPGLELDTDTAYYTFDDRCVAMPINGSVRTFTLGEPVTLPTMSRRATGNSRLQTIALGSLPFADDSLHDATFDIDCSREGDRCLPSRAGRVETWFADPSCTQAIDVAFAFGEPPTPLGRRGSTFYPILDVYSAQLYQLSTGDTCQTYNPPLVPHSVGPALGDDAFARATLMIE